MAVHDDDDPLWKRIVFNELMWVLIVIFLILFVAFHLATSRPPEEGSGAKPVPGQAV